MNLQSKPAAFFDRDGTLMFEPLGGFVSDPAKIEINEAAVEWVKRCNEIGVYVIVVTNQPYVARGLMREDEVVTVNDRLVMLFAQRGAEIDLVLHCPHDSRLVPCACRKPGTGMIKTAMKFFPNIDLRRSAVFGDEWTDEALARNLNVPFILVRRKSIDRLSKECASRFMQCEVSCL